MYAKVPIQPSLINNSLFYVDFELSWNNNQIKKNALLYSFKVNNVRPKIQFLPDSCPDILFGFDRSHVDIHVCRNRSTTEELLLNPDMAYYGFKPYSCCAINNIFDENMAHKLKDRMLSSKTCLERLRNGRNIQSKISTIIDFTRRNLLNESYRPGLVEKAELEICQKNGDLRVEDLCTNLEYSLGYCRQRFKDKTGLSLKQSCKILRFQNVIHLMRCFPESSLCGLAYDAGYFDQAHMIREFKHLSGLTPSRFRSSYFQNPEHSTFLPDNDVE